MSDIKSEIIDFLVRNRVSTTEVADALGKTGALEGIQPINRGFYRAGEIRWVYAYDESNWPLHEQIRNIQEDSIVMVDAFNCGGRSVFGELVSKYILLYQQSRAIVVRGNVRDAAALIRENLPIWSEGVSPIGCFNNKPSEKMDESVKNKYMNKYDGSIAVCDDCGVVIIPKENITKEFLKALHNIENQEDIWFDRLDHFKEDTFEIVCEKKYLHDNNYMKNKKMEG